MHWDVLLGDRLSLRWKIFKLIPNLQTIKTKYITIKQKSSLSASPVIYISLTRRGNRGENVHKTGYRRARRERKRKGEEFTLSTIEASNLHIYHYKKAKFTNVSTVHFF